MKIQDVLLQEGPWKKLGNHKGILTRTITPADREAAKKKEQERNKKRYAATKAGQLEELRIERIPEMGSEEIENLLSVSHMGIGGTIDDITSRKYGYKTVDGVKVASMTARVAVLINLRDDMGYDDKTIETMYDGRDTTEESFQVTVYRDPKNPKSFIGTAS